MAKSFHNILAKKLIRSAWPFLLLLIIGSSAWFTYYLATEKSKTETEFSTIASAYESLDETKEKLQATVASLSAEVAYYSSRDEYQINQNLTQEIDNINQTYQFAVETYERLLEVKDEDVQTEKLDAEFTKALIDLSERNYASASDKLKFVQDEAKNELAKIAAARAAAVPKAKASNTPPGSGYSRQSVSTDVGSFVVDLIAADLNSTRVVVDTASDGDCGNECPVLSLGDYVSRNGAFAGVNGSYFCPASYPSCAGKTNSFDTLAMGKNKHYHNSDNNVYSTVPAVIFGNGWVRFVGQSLEWGRDTSVDGVLANQPLLVSGGNIVFGGDGDPKKGSKSNRSFVANKGTIVYIGVVRSATVAESARVMAALGMENALNLDAGGSTALWSGGYKAGPGRNIPNAILFVRR